MNDIRDPKPSLLLPLLNNNNSSWLEAPTPTQTMVQLQHTANSAYQQKLASHLQAYHHDVALGTPVLLKLLCAINNNWLNTFLE